MLNKTEFFELLSIKDEKGNSVYIIDLLRAFARWSLNGIDLQVYKSPTVCKFNNDSTDSAGLKFSIRLDDDVGAIIDKAVSICKIKDPIGFCLFHAFVFKGLAEHEAFTSKFVRRTYKRYNQRFYLSEVNKLFTNFVTNVIKTLFLLDK